jgi:DNA-directed RNA polymerase alpha subunit
MKESGKNLRTCPNGHRYHKSSDCPVCPVCESEKSPAGDLPRLAAPARRALESAGIASLAQLSRFTEKEIMALHGMGPNALSKLREALKDSGLAFKQT